LVEHVLSVTLAFIGHSLLDVTKAVQKYAFTQWRRRPFRSVLIWTAAALSSTAAVFINLYAVSIGSVIIVGSMADTGLAALLLFSRLVLKEKFRPLHLAAVAAILAAPFLIVTIDGRGALRSIRVEALYMFFGIVAGGYAALIAFVTKPALRGALLGGCAGALGGFVVLFQKVATSPAGRSLAFFHPGAGAVSGDAPFPECTFLQKILEIFANPFAVIWIGLTLLSTLLIQFSYRHGDSYRIVPVFGANNILIPVVGGIFVFHEDLHILQWVGVVQILAAVMMLSLHPGESGGKPHGPGSLSTASLTKS
jgi:drug/metabolite transporter (DMT)-like permease